MSAAIEKVAAESVATNAFLLGRPFEAYRLLEKQFGIPGQVCAPFGTELFNEIYGWYIQRYERQMNPKINLSEMPVLIRGGIYFLRFPVAYGTVQMSVQIDIFQQIKKISFELLASLSQREKDEIASVFEKRYEQRKMGSVITSFTSVRVWNFVQEDRDSRGHV